MTQPIQEAEAELEGQPLINIETGQNIDGCRRCEEKNTKRHYAGLNLETSTFRRAEPVTIHAAYLEDDDLDAHWHITSVDHYEHPQLPFEDVVQSDTAFLRAQAQVGTIENRQVIVGVNVTNYSPVGEGPEKSTVSKLREKHIDTSGDHPAGVDVINIPASDPEPHWPESEREWLDEINKKHGPLKPPTFNLSADESDRFDFE